MQLTSTANDKLILRFSLSDISTWKMSFSYAFLPVYYVLCISVFYSIVFSFLFTLLLRWFAFGRNLQFNAHKDVTINNAEKCRKNKSPKSISDLLQIFCSFDMVVFRLLFRCRSMRY